MSEQDPLSFEVFKPVGPDEHGRRKVHPLTPLIQAVRWWPAVLIAMVTLPGQMDVSVGGGAVAIGGGVLILITSLAIGWNYLEWQRLSFWFDDDGDLRVQSGVLTKQERRLQVSRLQSVDVLQPLLARLAGLAEVRIEVAGAGDSRQSLQFLTLADANALRNEVIARSAGVRHDAEEAPETLLAKVPPGDLVLSLVLRLETAMLLLLTALLVTVTLSTAGPAGLVFVLIGGVPIFSVFAILAATENGAMSTPSRPSS